jgi:hypothetical protein
VTAEDGATYLWINILENIREALPRHSGGIGGEEILVVFADVSPSPHPLRDNAVRSLRNNEIAKETKYRPGNINRIPSHNPSFNFTFAWERKRGMS